jgi:hypothetical protein
VAIAADRRRRQTHAAVCFSPATQAALVRMVVDACTRRGWRAHAVGTNGTHVHLVASWTGVQDAVAVHGKLKNLLGLCAARVNGTRGRPWFSHGGMPKRVRDGRHLRRLVRVYLVGPGGLFWKEGDVLDGGEGLTE